MTALTIGFILILLALAFFILKKVVKMAIRALVVVLILAIAIAGAIAFYMFGKSPEVPKRPIANSNIR
jgi:hypothetical protein